jgi:hypothetical protein
MQCGADGFHRWQCDIRVACVGDHLAPHLGRGQASREAGGAALGVGRTLTIDDGWDIPQEGGEMHCRPLAPTPGKGIDTD